MQILRLVDMVLYLGNTTMISDFLYVVYMVSLSFSKRGGHFRAALGKDK